MPIQKIILTLAGCVVALLLTSCSSNNSIAKSDKASNISGKVKSSQFSQNSQSTQPNFGASLVAQAGIYNSSPGRVALSMLICRLDSSCVYSDLVKKSAKELFDIVSETAFEKDITLESLNSRYGLCDILASEKIYVSIESNNVTSLSKSLAKSSSVVVVSSASSAISSASSSGKSSKVSAMSSSSTSQKASASKVSATSSASTVTWEAKFQEAIIQTSDK